MAAGAKDLSKARTICGPDSTALLITFSEEDGQQSTPENIMKTAKSLFSRDQSNTLLLLHWTRAPTAIPFTHTKRSLFSILQVHRMHTLRFTIQAFYSTQLPRIQSEERSNRSLWRPRLRSVGTSHPAACVGSLYTALSLLQAASCLRLRILKPDTSLCTQTNLQTW